MNQRRRRLLPPHLFSSFFVSGILTFLALFSAVTVSAAWGGRPYNAGETLNPDCGPTDNLCTVATSTEPWVVDTNTGSISYGGGQVVAPSFSATSTSVASALQGLTFVSATGTSISLDLASIGVASTSQLSSTGTTTLATGGGAVGIGTATPEASLDVQTTNSSDAIVGEGTVSVGPDSDTIALVSGTGTHFTRDIRVGDYFYYGPEYFSQGTVIAVVTDTFIVLKQNFQLSVDGSQYAYQHPTVTIGNQNAFGNTFTLYTSAGSQALGSYNTVQGVNSTAIGASNSVLRSSNLEAASLAIGTNNLVMGDGAIAIGQSLRASSTSGIIVGSGIGSDFPLVNSVDNSLQVGFNSDISTLFVGGSHGSGTVGNVGIGTTTPDATLAVSGQVSISDNGSYFNPNLKNTGTPGLYAEWWDTQSSIYSPDYSLPAGAVVVADPSTDLYATRPDSISSVDVNARISGWIKADYSEAYTFCSASDDGSKVWVDGQEIVNNWFDQGTTERCGTANLIAGKWYPYYVEYYQGGGPASLTLLWSSASLEKESIPLDHTVNGGRFVNANSFDAPAFTVNAASTTSKLLSLVNFGGSELMGVATTSSYFNTKLGIGTSTPSATVEIAGPGAGSFAGGYPSLLNIHTADSNPWGLTFQNDTAGKSKESGMYLDNNGIFYLGSAAYSNGALGVSQVGNVSIGSYSAAANALSVTGKETTVNLTQLSNTEVYSPARHVEVSGTLAYITAGNFLEILDITDPNHVVYLGTYDFSVAAKTVRVVGTTAYVAAGNTVYLLDVSNPTVTPTLLGSFTTGTTVQDLRVSGNYAYVVDAGSSFYVLNIADPTNPYLYTPGSIETAFGTYGNARLAIGAGYAYIVEDNDLEIMRISDPANPSHVSSYSTTNSFYGDVAYSNGFLYLTKDAPGYTGSFVVLDVSDREKPVQIGSTNTGDWRTYTNIVLKNNRAYVSDGSPDSLYVVDISVPNSPVVEGHIGTSGNAYGVAVDSRDNVYAVDSTGGFYAFSTKTTKTSASFVNGNVGIGTTTPSAALSIVGTNTNVAISDAELTTNGVFDGSDYWTFDSDWSYDMSGGMVHTPAAIPSVLTESVPALVQNQSYLVQFAIENRTKGSVQVGLGDSPGGPVFNGDDGNPQTVREIVQAGNGGTISILPSTDFDGMIRNVSVKHVTQTDATVTLHNSDSSLGAEIRTGSGVGTLNSLFLGVGSGAFSLGNRVIAAGFGAAQNNVGNYVAAFGDGAAAQNMGNYLSAIGKDAALLNTGYNVTAIGHGAALQNSGSNVNAVGVYAASSNTGSYVDAIGYAALSGKTAGDGVVAVGSDSAESGWFHGTQTAISNSILLGASTHTAVDSSSSTTLDNIIAIGGRATQSNQVVIGNGSTTQTLLHGNVGIGTTVPSVPLAVEGAHTISFLKQGSFSSTGSYYTDIYAASSTVYALDNRSGLFIFDTTNPSNIKVKSVIQIENSPVKVVAEGNMVYVARQGDILAYDVSDPANAVLIDTYSSANNGVYGSVTSLFVKNGLVYAGNNAVFSILDYSAVSVNNQVDPVFLGSKNIGNSIYAIIVRDGSAYLSTQGVLWIENVSGIGTGSPGTPGDISSYSVETTLEDLAISGNYLYTIGMDMVVRSFDITDPTVPKLLDTVRLDARYQDQQHIRILGNYAYVSDGTPDSIYALYIADPANMTLAGHVATQNEAMGLTISDGLLYVAEGYGGGEVFSVSIPQATVATFTNGNVGIGTTAPQAVLHVAGLGGNDGLKFAGNYKTALLGVSNPTAKEGKYLYTLTAPNAFDIIDTSDPNHLKWTGTFYAMADLTSNIQAFDKHAYVTDTDGRLWIVDVSNPRSPTVASVYTSNSGYLSGVVAANNYFVYALDASGNIEEIYVQDTSNVSSIGTFSPQNGASSFYTFVVAGSKIYALDDSGYIEIIDVSNPISLSYLGRYSPNTGETGSFKVVGDTLYASVSGYSNKIEIADVSDPANPYFVAEYNSPTSSLHGLAVSPGFVFSLNNAGHIEVIDVSDRQHPKYVSEFKAQSGSYGYPLVSGKYLYATNGSDAIEAIDISNPKPSVVAAFTGGRVGVGTTNPNAAFSVVGTGGDGMSRKGAYATPYAFLSGYPFTVGTTTFALDNSQRLEAIDTSDPTAPKFISALLSATSSLSNLYVSGSYAYFTDTNGQINIVDVSDPANMVYKNTILASSMPAYKFVVRDSLLYVVDDNGDLEVWNVSDPINLSLVNTFHDGSALLSANYQISLVGNTVYARNNNGTISVIDVANPQYMSKIAEITPNTGGVDAFGVLDNTLFIGDSSGNALEFFNISTPDSPAYVTTYNPASFASTAHFNPISPGTNGYLYVTDGCALRVLDISNPANPREVDSYEPNDVDECYAAPFIGGGHAYGMTMSGQMVIFDVSGVAHPSLAATFADGRVGVGTENPLALFDVSGNMILSGMNRYLNFDGASGLSGYGFRDDHGTLQFKNYGGTWTNFGTGSGAATTTWEFNGSNLYFATTTTQVGIGTSSPQATLDIDSGVDGVSGLRFSRLNSDSTASTTATGILGIDASGNVVISPVTSPLTSQVLAYWDGLNDPTTGSQAFPQAELTGDAVYVPGSGVMLTDALDTQNGSMNWSFTQLPFERTQFNFKAGGGTGADSTWFYSYADGVPSDELGEGMTKGYIIYFSEYHACAGISYGPYGDGQQCGSGGVDGQPLASASLGNIGDDQWHSVDISTIYNHIIVRWDGSVIIDYTDTYGRDLTGLKFGFGARTGGSNNAHFIKGLVVSKLGTNIAEYGIASTTAIESGLYWDAQNGRLGVGNATPTEALDVSGNIYASGDICSAAICLSDLSPSDQRFKKNITSLTAFASTTEASSVEDILGNIMKLNPVTYNWNDTYLKLNPGTAEATSTKIGFIAQEMQNVFPQVVGHTSNGFLGIDYSKLTSVLTAGMQEMVNVGGVFKTNLVAWFGGAQNGIASFFANEAHLKKICLAKSDGTEVCINGDDLQKIQPSLPASVITVPVVVLAPSATTTATTTDSSATTTPIASPVVSPVITPSADVATSSTPIVNNSTTTSSVEYQGATSAPSNPPATVPDTTPATNTVPAEPVATPDAATTTQTP